MPTAAPRLEPADRSRGFSIIELVLAMTITLGVGLVVFQMFSQNEAVFQDQNRVLEMQQSVRAVASMIADEIRMAGQGVPLYSAAHEETVAEAVQAFLPGTDASTVRFRAAARNAALTTTATPSTFVLHGGNQLLGVNTSAILSAVGENSNRFVYIWGPTESSWTWVRAQVNPGSSFDTQLSVTPRQMSSEGGALAARPSVFLEEGVSYRLNNGTVLRGEATNFTSLTAPTFLESAIGDNFTSLEFTYYDALGAAIDPVNLALRHRIRRVDFVIAAETNGPLSTGQPQTYAISMSVHPRNLEVQ